MVNCNCGSVVRTRPACSGEGTPEACVPRTLVLLPFTQRGEQSIDRVQQGTRISIHPIYRIAVHRRQRRFLIALEELADAYDYVERRAQFVINGFQIIGFI